jgi:hypothetical protein
VQAGVDITDAATLGPALWEGVTQVAIAVGPVFGKLPGGGMGCAPSPGALTQLALAAAALLMGADGVRRAACMTPPCVLRAHADGPAHWADTTHSCWGLASAEQGELAAFSNPQSRHPMCMPSACAVAAREHGAFGGASWFPPLAVRLKASSPGQ